MACPRPDERPLRPSRPSRRLSRRDLLVWSGQVPLAAVALSSCSFLSTEPNTDKRSDTDPTTKKGKEAPRLAAEVKAGRLPPVAERLPKKPLVVEPVERMGVYGGEWNTAVLGAADGAWLYRTIGYEHLVNWDRGWTEPIPNIAESLEVEDDGRRFVFHLREGMRWSDGEPFTADDVVFAYDDVLMYEELSPQPPAWLVTDGNPGTIEKIDDFTVQFEFSAPNGLFLENIAQPAGEGLTNKPKHYLSKFHKKYVDNVDELAKKEKHADWLALFWAKASPFDYVGLPRITPWLITTPLGKGSRVVAERNPYYWKTDPDGSQLPYIDRIVYQVINDAETMTLAATSGAYDMHERHITTAQNKPVLARGREKGNYHFVEEIGSSMNSMVIALNLTHK
ncbi:MAG TPA: ABC transporter substrate-binding protein, partial [Actinopolymorphaceae bacterium]